MHSDEESSKTHSDTYHPVSYSNYYDYYYYYYTTVTIVYLNFNYSESLHRDPPLAFSGTPLGHLRLSNLTL